MYNIDIFDNCCVQLDWTTIYYGIKNDFFNIQVARDYAIRRLENEAELSQEELELSWGIEEKLDVLELIEKIPNMQLDSESQKIEAKRKLRIAIVVFLRNSIKEYQDLFENIDMIYSDFDFPRDMESFISYMPITDGYNPLEHSEEENENRLLNKLDCFIVEELKTLRVKV